MSIKEKFISFIKDLKSFKSAIANDLKENRKFYKEHTVPAFKKALKTDDLQDVKTFIALLSGDNFYRHEYLKELKEKTDAVSALYPNPIAPKNVISESNAIIANKEANNYDFQTLNDERVNSIIFDQPNSFLVENVITTSDKEKTNNEPSTNTANNKTFVGKVSSKKGLESDSFER